MVLLNIALVIGLVGMALHIHACLELFNDIFTPIGEEKTSIERVVTITFLTLHACWPFLLLVYVVALGKTTE